MAQQIINIGAAPNDGGGDQLRLSFNKCNDNFTELYAKGVIEGLWNYNKTSTDTSTSPVSGRFKTNSGNYRDATQIAIHAITIQGIDRTSTLRALLVGDSIQSQDSTNSAAWCRYSLQSLPVDHGTWFQLNVTFQTDGGVTSGDNQEIVFVFTAGSGGADLSAYAPLASPTFTGDPQAPTPTTGDNDFSIATTAFVQDAVSSASGGAAGTAEYNFSTIISPPPNSGDIRVNNATPSAATILWINNVTRLGSDIKRILQQIQVGSKLVIQDKGNSANYGAFQVAGALVDQTTYWEIPVTFSVGAGTIANNARILFGVQAPGATANVSNSGTPTVGQYAKWVTATTIQGVAPATVLSDIGAQPAGSYQPLDATLTALAAYNTNGLLTQTAADTFTGRTLTGPAAGITVSNGNGVAGNPTLALANDLSALEALAGTNTIYYRSAIDTWTGVTIGANLTFSGGTLAVTIPANYITSVSAPLSVTGSNLAIDLTAYLTTAAATAAYQPLDGDLTAIAALTGTNTIYYRSAANTWSPVVVSTGLAFSGGNLTATGGGGNVSNSGTPTAGQIAQWTDAIHIQGITAPFGPPQGRLTLQTGMPVMTSTQSAITTIYYTPSIGNTLPIYDGTSMIMTTFAELSVATTDTTKSPAAIGVSKVNDWFIWNDAGTLRIGHGPDWTSDTARSAGTALTMVNGINLNNTSITNGPAASRGTYVGTTRSNASSALDWIYGGADVQGWFGVWNAYNRQPLSSLSYPTADTWTYTTAAWRHINGSAAAGAAIHRFVVGLNEAAAEAQYFSTALAASSGSVGGIGVGFDATLAKTGIAQALYNTSASTAFFNGCGVANVFPGIGWHTFAGIEFGASGLTFIGDNAAPGERQVGLVFRWWA